MLEYGEAFMKANERALQRLADMMGPAFDAALWMADWADEEGTDDDVPDTKSEKLRRRS